MVAGHVRVEQEPVLVRFQGPQLGHPFGRLPILRLRVVKARRHILLVGHQRRLTFSRPDSPVRAGFPPGFSGRLGPFADANPRL